MKTRRKIRRTRFVFCAIGILLEGSARSVRADDSALKQSASAVKTEAVAESPVNQEYETQIRPIFTEHCAGCHGSVKQKSQLRLDQFAYVVRGGINGPVIRPGSPDDSRLVQAIRYDGDLKMPPAGKLPQAKIEAIEQWVKRLTEKDFASEATAKSSNQLKSDKQWAFAPIQRPEPPETKRPESVANPVDQFIAARLDAEKLQPSPTAEPATLARRLSLDLLGLPPDPAQVGDYLSNPTDEAWTKLVDRMLDSPRYGERWAEHWLDVARWAETNGFETNTPRPNAWPYRDYVIESFNADKPYDRFIVEQIAGDALGVPAATGFLVAGAWDEVKSPDRELTLNQRANEIHDMVATTGSAFLGLTVGCARCHDHKFDPITQKDYYAMSAILAGVSHGEQELPDPNEAALRAEAGRLRAQLRKVETQLLRFEPQADPRSSEPRRAAVQAKLNVDRFASVEARAVRFTIEATNSVEPCLDELEVWSAEPESRNVALASSGGVPLASGTYEGNAFHKLEHINDGLYGNEHSWISSEAGRGWIEIRWPKTERVEAVGWGRDRNGAFSDRLPIQYRIEMQTPFGDWFLVASHSDRQPRHDEENEKKEKVARAPHLLDPKADPEAWIENQFLRERLNRKIAEIERRKKIYSGTFAEPEPTHLFFRGDPLQPREPVAPGGISAVHPSLALPPDMPEKERRVALARWIASRDNPLTARVMVNRIWHYHFGCGLVSTPSDFGANGDKPSHPELLDWLASEFMDHQWSVKHVQRLILLSKTYRRSSSPNEKNLSADAGDRLLWRYPPRRLEAEAIRDSVLWVSGKLDLAVGGPGFDLFEPNTNYVHVYNPKTRFGPAEWRRMVYQIKARNVPDSTFGIFDCPEAAQPAPRRTASTTPLQALNLLNSPFMMEQSRFFAERLKRECAGANLEDEVRRGFMLALGRPPDASETTASDSFARNHGLDIFCRALFNANEFLRIE